MLLVSQGPGGALSARRCRSHPNSPLKFTHKNPPLFFYNTNNNSSGCGGGPKFISNKRRSFYRYSQHLTLAKADGSVDSSSTTNNSPPPPFRTDETIFVGQEDVPLEGVIQFEKPSSSSSSSRSGKWRRVALFSAGDVLALLLFSAIGRFNHGYSVFDIETLRTADPLIAGWFLGAYLLGGYGEDGRGMNGVSKAVVAAIKSWAVGIPVGLIVRAAISGHIPLYTFILVTMGTTGVLLVGWRALLTSFLPTNKSEKNDTYRRGSPFELFELLTSLVRRW